MKQSKRLTIVIMTVALAAASATVSSAAPKPKLSKTKVTLTAGKTSTITLKNSKKKVKWSTSKKAVVTVKAVGKNKVKLTAKKKGSATITAKVGKQKYLCKVTVKAAPKAKAKTKKPAKSTKKPAKTTPKKTKYVAPDNRVEKYHYVIGLGESAEINLLGALDNDITTSVAQAAGYDSGALNADIQQISKTKYRVTGKHYGSYSFYISLRSAQFKKSKVTPLITCYVVPSKTHGLGIYSTGYEFRRVNSLKTTCPVGGAHNVVNVYDESNHIYVNTMSTLDTNGISTPYVVCTKCGQAEALAKADSEGLSYTTLNGQIKGNFPFLGKDDSILSHIDYERGFYSRQSWATDYMNKYFNWLNQS